MIIMMMVALSAAPCGLTAGTEDVMEEPPLIFLLQPADLRAHVHAQAHTLT